MENEQADAGRDGFGPSRETKLSGANGDREILTFSVQLTTSRIGNLTRLVLLLLYVMTRREQVSDNLNASKLSEHPLCCR